MKGTTAILDAAAGNGMAALMRNGQLQDLLFDLDPADTTPIPGAIYRAVVDRPLKGMGAGMLRLGNGQSGFLKGMKGLAPGDTLLVQIATFADDGKAVPVSTKILFKSRYVIVTPSAPGINVSRSIKDEDQRDALLEIAHEARGEGTEGLILRSVCADAEPEAIAEDIEHTITLARDVMADVDGAEPELLLAAPTAALQAWRDWPSPEEVVETEGAFESHGVWEAIAALESPRTNLSGGAWMTVEPTRALVAVDVNTGGDFSPAAALKANLAAARELPRQLRLRGLGGQIVVDFAPMNKRNRTQIEGALRAALRQDSVETMLVGWTPL
ncbi:MAG TPA: ribonuclease E/G, partial [Paracoccaceae bacterium]|nr:ribonuclease E/G [Paracoccaceae bacterium]